MNGWFVPVAVVGVAIANMVLGYRWNRLDRNPWAGKPLDGLFTTPVPGWSPAALDVDAINRRGRRLMICSPIVSALFLALYLSNN